MRVGLVMLGVAVALSARAQGAREAPPLSLEEALRAFQDFAPSPQPPRSSITLRPREMVIPNLAIYCEASQCGRAAAKLCSDLGYGGSRAIPATEPAGGGSGSVGVVCFDP